MKNPGTTSSSRCTWRLGQRRQAANADTVVTNDPMEATYVGIHMWAQAVEKAKSTDTDKVIAAMAGQTFNAPSGCALKMDDKTSHHLQAGLHRRDQRPDGQFNVVWKTRADPAPSRGAVHPGNENKQKL